MFAAATSFYAILSGGCDLHHKPLEGDGREAVKLSTTADGMAARADLGVFVAKLGPGECIGELSSIYLDARPVSAVVVADAEPASLLQVDKPGASCYSSC